ncbi:hypothetical protein KAS08_03320 [Candidatus Pacearchaeota archaeon]|nr:hypothetical protein [Candidatus Pacearchaeota archaeon]
MMDNLKELFNKEMTNGFLVIENFVIKFNSDGSREDFLCDLDNVLHKIQGMLLQAGLMDSGATIQKQKTIFKKMFMDKTEVDKKAIKILEEDIELVKKACVEFVESKKELII